MKKEKVAILGASPDSERYSYKAFKKLEENQHEALLVSPKYEKIEGHKVYKSLSELPKVDTLTVYVNPKISSTMKEDIKKLNPKRVIFNPGTENSELQSELSQSGIEVVEACTLVLLSTDQF